ncbi:hypothetical protein CH63R_03266 [Colletotrichum higginsianum IMI 349063]|uniref:Uncharacterized protein n=2 Tax=Colletotrichum higginsianum TaxID=80884 RepID=A0A1B7YR64_COLHI|nr:hypothetical protein CH63R_03266 [Colletotrichum higginsianum IMI 349063]OBR14540.1 hypothetical protein CH63R_03266 [Colletotrichum higginsianum IMI 349063]TID01996.1 hypothetical protein CH35J_004649 [Colletotrichum higginsianum]GJC94792.1 hypothetical protein ColKHC_03618 [Colletotrichum higginsianum]
MESSHRPPRRRLRSRKMEISADATVVFARAVRSDQDPEPSAIAFSEMESVMFELGFSFNPWSGSRATTFTVREDFELQPVTLHCTEATAHQDFEDNQILEVSKRMRHQVG